MKRELFWTAGALGAKTAGQLFLTLAVVTQLDPTSAGLWFLFVSLGSVAQFFDMGLASSVLRSASHFYAGLKSLKAQGVDADRRGEPNMPGLKDLMATTAWIYNILGLVVLFLGFGVAIWVLPSEANDVGRLAWMVYAVNVCLQLMVSQRYNFMQGVGRLAEAQQIQTWGLLITFGASGAVLFGSGSLLWACVAFMAGCLAQLLCYSFRLAGFRGGRAQNSIFRALWPNSWRSGLTRLSYALIYHLPTVVISHVLGVAVAGSYGFTLQVFLFLLALAQLPITPAVPRLNELAAHGSLEELKKLFFGRLRQMFVLYGVLVVGLVVVAPGVLVALGSKTQLLGWPLLVGLAVFFFFENHRNNHILLVNAFNRAPFWKYDIASGVVIIAGSASAVAWGGVGGFILWMGLVQLAWNFWWPVREGLRTLKTDWESYSKSVFGF